LSALPLKPDKEQTSRDVRFVPKADKRTAANSSLFDHLIGASKQRGWDGETERLGSLED
jgi:hypothetical protein